MIEWITDKEPERNGTYLATIEWQDIPRHTDILEWCGTYWSDCEGWALSKEEVVAWAEMPNPWEG